MARGMKRRLTGKDREILAAVFKRWKQDYLQSPENGQEPVYAFRENEYAAGLFPTNEYRLQDEHGYDLLSVGINKQGRVVFFFQGLGHDDCRQIEASERPVYVTSTDSFFSGWGKAEGMKNKLAIECTSREEAEIVMENARRRGDQKYVNYTYDRPRERRGILWSRKNKGTFSKWFQPHAF